MLRVYRQLLLRLFLATHKLNDLGEFAIFLALESVSRNVRLALEHFPAIFFYNLLMNSKVKIS